MMLRNTRERYGALAQLVRRLTVAFVIGQLVTMNLAADLPRGPERLALYDLHKSFGVTTLGLAIALLVVAGAHALAAPRHHSLLKDVLRRMLPWGRR